MLPSLQEKFGLGNTYLAFAGIGAIALVSIYLTVPGAPLLRDHAKDICSQPSFCKAYSARSKSLEPSSAVRLNSHAR